MATPTSLPSTFVAGNVLTAAEMNNLRGAFRILQVVRATDGTNRSTTSSSFVDADISVTITPTSSDSDILLVWSLRQGTENTSGSNTRSRFQITDSSNVAISGAEEAFSGPAGVTGFFFQHLTIVGYDSPATTSATTYKGRFARALTDVVTVNIQNSSNTGQLIALEISA